MRRMRVEEKEGEVNRRDSLGWVSHSVGSNLGNEMDAKNGYGEDRVASPTIWA